MQTPKSSSSVSAPRKKSPQTNSSLKSSPQAAAASSSSEASKNKASPQVVRKLKTGSPNTVAKVSDHKSPKSSRASQEKSPSRVSELESQVSKLEKDLETVSNQLQDTEASKKRAEKDAEEANKQVLALSLKLEESQKKLSEKSVFSEISQEQEQSSKSHLESAQKQQSCEKSELESIQFQADPENKSVELSQLGEKLSETLSLVEDMKNQLREGKESNGTVDETLMHLANAKKMVDMIRSVGLKPVRDYEAVVSELEKSRARGDYLEDLVGKLELEISETGRREEELKRSKDTIEELKANLMDKETELQGICEENEGLTKKLEESLSGQRERELEKELESFKAHLLEKETELENVKSQVNGDVAPEEEDNSMKVGYLMEEIDKSNKKVTRLTEQLEAAQAVNADMEGEMKRLKVQSLQWRKAAEAAAALVSAGANNNRHSPNSKKTNLPFGDELDDDVLKKKNANGLRRFWKKPHK